MSIAKKLFGSFVEFDESPELPTKPTNPSAAPNTVAPAAAPPSAAVHTATTESAFTPDEISRAQRRVLDWAGYSKLTNLQKFVKLEEKLSAKIPDDAMAADAALEAIEVSGIATREVVKAEALTAINGIASNLAASQLILNQDVAGIRAEHSTVKENYDRSIAKAQEELSRLQAERAGLDAKFEAQEVTLFRENLVTGQVAEQMLAAWKILS